jgi:hypothetical protein
MTEGMAASLIEAGHIAHDGLPHAYLEFGKDEERKHYIKIEFTSEYGPSHALEGLVRLAKEHPDLKGDHLFWRKRPTLAKVEGLGYHRAWARLLCSNRFDVVLDVSEYPTKNRKPCIVSDPEVERIMAQVLALPNDCKMQMSSRLLEEIDRQDTQESALSKSLGPGR